MKALFQKYLGDERAFGAGAIPELGRSPRNAGCRHDYRRPHPRTPPPGYPPLSRAFPRPFKKLGPDSKELTATSDLAVQLSLWESRFLQPEHSGNPSPIGLPLLRFAQSQETTYRESTCSRFGGWIAKISLRPPIAQKCRIMRALARALTRRAKPSPRPLRSLRAHSFAGWF